MVFATYQSLPQIIEALQGTGIEFDLTIADEAHKTTGKTGALFTKMHDNAALPSKKRLYMTATPKVHTVSTRAQDTLGEYADMSNQAIYGPEFHRMSFAKAIEQDILSDYEIVAVGINEQEIRDQYPDRTDLQDPDVLAELAHNLALEKVMTKHNASHALTFHSTVLEASDFQKRHQGMYPQVNSYHVSSKFNVKKRQDILDEFASKPYNEHSVISNARCLTEGVDVPSIDMVYFTKPKKSKVDIVQAAGRALRKNKAKPGKIGRIVVPIILKPGESVARAARTGKFANLIHVVTVLADHDERLEAQLTNSTTNKPGEPSPKEERPKIVLEGFDPSLMNAFKDEIIASSRESLTGSKFANFAELQSAAVREYPTAPSGIYKALTKLGITMHSLKNLLKREGLNEPDSDPGAERIKQLIWDGSSNSLENIFSTVRTISPTKPKDLKDFFNNNSQFKHQFSIFPKFIQQVNGLWPEAWGQVNKPYSVYDIADWIWGAKYDSFQGFKDAILKIYEERRPQTNRFVPFLEGHFQTGLRTLAKLAIAKGLLSDSKPITTTDLMNLIWVPAAKANDTLDTFTTFARGRHPSRPENPNQAVADLLKARALNEEDIFSLLKTDPKYKDAHKIVYENQNAYVVLAEHIWPRVETREEFTTRLVQRCASSSWPQSTSRALLAKILNDTGVSVYSLLERYPEFVALDPQPKRARHDIKSDILLGLFRSQDPQTLALYYKTEEVLAQKTAPEILKIFLDETLFKNNFGVSYEEYIAGLLTHLEYTIGEETKDNKYRFARRAQEVLNFGSSSSTSIRGIAVKAIKDQYPNPPKTLDEIKEIWQAKPAEAAFIARTYKNSEGVSFLLSEVWRVYNQTIAEDGNTIVTEKSTSLNDVSLKTVDAEVIRETQENEAITKLVGPFRTAQPECPADLAEAKKAVGGLGKWLPLRKRAIDQNFIPKSLTTDQQKDQALMNLIWPLQQ